MNGTWIYGAIETEYQAMINIGRPLGNPTTGELNASRDGKWQQFGSNSIYWHPLVDGGRAHQIGGSIRDKWGSQGWEDGPLRYPTTRENLLSKQSGRFNHFEGGSIYWTSSTGAFIVWGAIRDKWAQAGWENSSYGYPTSDEYEYRGGFRQNFQGGFIDVNVGPEPSMDPSGTNNMIGGDDPLNRFSGMSGSRISLVQKCSPKLDGRRVCMYLGPGGRTPTDVSPAPTTTTTVPPEVLRVPGQAEEVAPTTQPAATTTTATPTVAATPAPTPASSTPTTARPQNRPFPAQDPSTGPEEGPQPDLTEAEYYQEQVPPGMVPRDPQADPNEGVAGEPGEPSKPDAQARGASPQPYLPSWCATKPRNQWNDERYYSCFIGDGSFTVEYDDAPDLVMNATWEASVDTSQLSTSPYMQIRITPDGGVPLAANMSALAYCNNSKCTANLESQASGPTPLTVGKVGRFYITAPFKPLGAEALVTDYIMFKATVDIEGTSIVEGGLLPSTPIRCDSQSMFGSVPGCVNSNGGPILDLTTTQNAAPELTNHVRRAQNSGLGGHPSTLTRMLHRISDAAPQYARNRNTACPARYTRPAGKTCDEYPFASTGEGAGNPINANNGRTFDGCQIPLPVESGNPGGLHVIGWSSCMIISGQNSAGGGLLPDFHKKNRLLFGDGYWVTAG